MYSKLASIFARLSEFKYAKPAAPGTSFPYITCNEQNQQEILHSLSKNCSENNDDTQLSNTLHIGFSVWYNLDIICTTRPDYAIFLDIDPNVYYVYSALVESIACAVTRDDFITQFIGKLQPLIDSILDSNRLIHKALLKAEMKSLLSTELGFLANDKGFLYLKKKIDCGEIFFGTANLSNHEHMAKLKSWILEQNLNLQTLYLSNIPEWIIQYSRGNKDNFLEILGVLKSKDTTIIDAWYCPSVKNRLLGPPLRKTEDKLPNYDLSVKRNRRIQPNQDIRKSRKRLLFTDASTSTKTTSGESFSSGLFRENMSDSEKTNGAKKKRTGPRVNDYR